jgi:hypothetical protein
MLSPVRTNVGIKAVNASELEISKFECLLHKAHRGTDSMHGVSTLMPMKAVPEFAESDRRHRALRHSSCEPAIGSPTLYSVQSSTIIDEDRQQQDIQRSLH